MLGDFGIFARYLNKCLGTEISGSWDFYSLKSVKSSPISIHLAPDSADSREIGYLRR